ncbi:MAG: LysM peptidoglycan-binding domain-containing protein [Bacilli bacterium]|nr:LysM peptidoglycan-binding domain-containing protein [Bacilli bacterium]
MQIIKKINRELEFNYNISEITSICMDIDYKVNNNRILGILNLEGDYVSSNFEDTREDFDKKIDFSIDLDENIDLNTVKVEIDDFTYSIDQNKLLINVDLSLSYEFILFDEKKEFDKFIESREIDANKIEEDREEESKDLESVEEIKEEANDIEEIREEKIEKTEEIEETHKGLDEDKRKIEDSIIDMASNFEDEFITYHIYIVNDVDTLEGIAEKYHISIDIIKEYNSVENLKSGMKLVIPICDE